MKNNIVAFKYEEQQVRTIEKNGEPWFVGKDVAAILGYTNPNEAIADHVDDEDKLNSKTLSSCDLSLGQRGGWLINESGLYSLILSSKLPTAKEFKHWVTSEVLPSIRKTGEYKITPAQQNRLDIMERNSRAREASLWLRISAQVKSDTYRQVCASYASTVLAGREVIPLPQTTQQTEPELLGKPVNDKAPQQSTAPLGKPIEDKKQLTEKLSDALDALLHHSADTTEK